MKKMVALAAFAAVMSITAVVSAATVDIFVRQVSATDWTVGATSTVDDVGSISLQVVGFTGRTLAALPQIGAADSPFVGDTSGATVQIVNSVISGVAQNLVPSGQPELVLATLTGPGPFTINSGDDAFGFTVTNRENTDVIADYSLAIVPIPVPEPATMVLLGLGLAGLGMVRRAA